MVFAIITYFVITVATFGVVLITLGYTQSSVDNKRIRLAYITTFVIILIYAKTKPLMILVHILGL